MTSVLDQIHNNPNGAAYFNGTMCPLISDGDCEYEDKARRLIKVMLEKGVSLQEQGDLYYEQMVHLENSLHRICGDEHFNKDNIAAWCKEIDLAPNSAMSLWYLNVRTLLILGRIKNDDNFGMMFSLQVGIDK